MDGQALLLAVAGLSVVAAIAFAVGGLTRRWGWLRYGLLVGLLALLAAFAYTDSWPDGLGQVVCEEQLGGAAEDTPVEVCGPVGVTDMATILVLLAVAFLVAPDVSELELAGIGSLKARVETQEDRLRTVEGALAVSAATARSSASVIVQGQIAGYRVSGEKPGMAGQAGLEAALAALRGIYEEAQELEPDLAIASFSTYEFRAGRLVPISMTAQEEIFSPGKGATGQAWTSGEPVIVFGPDVHNSAYGLTDAQQEYFSDYTGVGAVPIRDLADEERIIGVLTAGTTDPKYMDLVDDQEAMEAWAVHLEATAVKVAVILQLVVGR